MKEIWKPIPGYEGYYEASNLGRIRSLERKMVSSTGKIFSKPGRIRIPVLNKVTGYYAVVLCGEKTKKTITVHRLIAMTFLDNLEGKECVNHKSEDKHDNRAENLEWCSKAYNNHYGSMKTASYKPVIAKCLSSGKETRFPNARVAAKQTGANYKNISSCCRGLRNQAAGYEWRYA